MRSCEHLARVAGLAGESGAAREETSPKGNRRLPRWRWAAGVAAVCVCAGAAPLSLAEDPYELLWLEWLVAPSHVVSSSGIAVDAAGNALISGTTKIDGDWSDAFLAKFDASGSYQWMQSIGMRYDDFGNAVAVDTDGNAILAGRTTLLFGRAEAFVAKYDPTGRFDWGRAFGIGLGQEDQADAAGVATDAGGNIYLAGGFYGSGFGGSTDDSGVFLAKFTPTGSMLWSRQFEDPYANGFDVALDTTGNVYVAGVILDQEWDENDALLLKYDADGELLWARQFGRYDESEYAFGVAVDAGGNAVVCGRQFVARYDPDGNQLWYKRTYGVSAFDVAVDASGAIFVANGMATRALVKYTPSGDELWTRPFDYSLHGVAVGSDGDIYVTGQGFTGLGEQGIFVARLGGECYPDCDESGELDFFDFLCFQNAFAAADPYADCDGSGAHDFFDFLCFQNAFAAGCP